MLFSLSFVVGFRFHFLRFSLTDSSHTVTQTICALQLHSRIWLIANVCLGNLFEIYIFHFTLVRCEIELGVLFSAGLTVRFYPSRLSVAIKTLRNRTNLFAGPTDSEAIFWFCSQKGESIERNRASVESLVICESWSWFMMTSKTVARCRRMLIEQKTCTLGVRN